MQRTAVAPTRWLLAVAAALVTLLSIPVSLRAQDAALEAEAYIRPADPIAEAVLAPRHLNVTLNDVSPDRRWFVVTRNDGLPKLADYGRPAYNLGGLQIDPAASRARTMTTRSAAGISVVSWEDGRSIDVQLPRGARVTNATWSPDGRQLAFFTHTENATHIHVADPATGRARQVTRTPVLATLNTSIEWTSDGRHIATVLIPENRGREPQRPAIAPEPMVRLTTEGENRLRTYPSLLETPYDMQLVEYHTTGQLALIDVRNGSVRRIGRPAMINSVSVAPDGDFIRVGTMQKPFSYIVPVNMFGGADEVWDLNGNVVVSLGVQALRDGTPADTTGQADERRSIEWRPDGQGLSFLQLAPAPANGPQRDAADAPGATNAQANRRRDRVMQWLPPFDSSSQVVVYENEARINSVRYSGDARVLFLTERTGNTMHEFAVYVDDPSQRHTISRVAQDEFYDNPGSLVQGNGRPAAGGGFGGGGGFGARSRDNTIFTAADHRFAYLAGTRYHEDPEAEAPKPFLDRVEIRTGEKTRIYEGDNRGVSEQLLVVLDNDASQLIISRESPTQVPNSFLRAADGSLRQLTENRDYTPRLTSAQRRRLTVTRADGFTMKVDVTLPADYVAGTRLPGIIWFYPREYDSQEAYDRTLRTYNPNRFPNIGTRTMAILTEAGYAVIEPDAPITGPTGRMNDNYVHDLRNNLAAVIDEVDRLGLVDRQRLAAGGHSYGAFSTVNAMVHTPFFKAGIAGDGAYNRTLTPLGFQSERRTFWEAREVYLGMSPFLYANNLTGALLMYHGLEDQNVGTFLINSERLFHALNGLNRTASLYIYPYEDHGPATEETLLDLWARWTAWLDRYVKGAPTPPTTAATSEQR